MERGEEVDEEELGLSLVPYGFLFKYVLTYATMCLIYASFSLADMYPLAFDFQETQWKSPLPVKCLASMTCFSTNNSPHKFNMPLETIPMILSLPTEMIMSIAEYLDPASLCCLATVSRKLFISGRHRCLHGSGGERQSPTNLDRQTLIFH